MPNSGAGTVKKKDNQVTEHLAILQNNISIITQEIDTLEGDLNGVLRGNADSDVKADVPDEVLVPIAGEIRNANNKVCSVKRTIKSILDRLEL